MDISNAQIQATLMSQQNQALGLARGKLEDALSEKELAKVEEAAKEFEAVFISEMMKPMFEGIKPDPVFGGGSAEKTYKGMMLQEYGKSIVEAGGIGIAEHVRAELIKAQQEARRR